jgi:hypothetical protein
VSAERFANMAADRMISRTGEERPPNYSNADA